MPDKVKLNVKKNELEIEEGGDSFIGKLITGCHGKVKIKTPFGEREIHKIKKAEKKSK